MCFQVPTVKTGDLAFQKTIGALYPLVG